MKNLNDFCGAGGDKRIAFAVLRGDSVEDILYHAVYDIANSQIESDPKEYCKHVLIVKDLLEKWYKDHDPLPGL